jgi:hypothetical protein
MPKPPIDQRFNYRWITVIDIWKGELLELWAFEVEAPLWFWEC